MAYTEQEQLKMMTQQICPRCNGLTLFENDPRYSIGYERVKYYHCLNCGMYAFIKQTADFAGYNWSLWWKQAIAPSESKTVDQGKRGQYRRRRQEQIRVVLANSLAEIRMK